MSRDSLLGRNGQLVLGPRNPFVTKRIGFPWIPLQLSVIWCEVTVVCVHGPASWALGCCWLPADGGCHHQLVTEESLEKVWLLPLSAPATNHMFPSDKLHAPLGVPFCPERLAMAFQRDSLLLVPI